MLSRIVVLGINVPAGKPSISATKVTTDDWNYSSKTGDGFYYPDIIATTMITVLPPMP